VSVGDIDAVTASLAQGADVNATNDRGQTPLILAIIAGQLHLIGRLLSAGADPLLEDSTGLNAIGWAERKGQTHVAEALRKGWKPAPPQRKVSPPPEVQQKRTAPADNPTGGSTSVSPDEKSRRFVAGLKQRLDEQASRETTASSQPEPQATLIQTPEPAESTFRPSIPDPQGTKSTATVSPVADSIERTPRRRRDVTETQLARTEEPILSSTVPARSDPLEQTMRSSGKRKVCPECGAVYNSDLLAYCSYDAAQLVDEAKPFVSKTHSASSVMLWPLVLIALVLGGLLGLFVVNTFFKTQPSTAPTPAAVPVAMVKGVPAVAKPLADKTVFIPEAEVPANAVSQQTTVTVKILVDKKGRVSSASGTGGDEVLNDAAVAAARKSTFDPQKLRGLGAAGSITYTFR